MYSEHFYFLEMQKFLSTFFFQWDEEMTCPDTGEAPVCNTSDLNEELGQVCWNSCEISFV